MYNRTSIFPDTFASFLLIVVTLFGFFLSTSAVLGAPAGKLPTYLPNIPPSELFDGADRYGEQIANTPVVPVLSGDKLVGYVFLNTDFVSAIGYSGKPIVVLIAMTAEGRIAAGRLLHHAEPIVLSGIPEQKIVDFIAGYKGTDILKLAREKGGEPPPVDIVSRATVTIMVIDDSIKRAAVRAAAALGLGGLAGSSSVAAPKKTLVLGGDTTVDWQTLVGNGSVRRMRLSLKDVNDAFVAQGNAKAIERPETGEDDEAFIDLYVASLAIPTIAHSLLGNREY
ncbi:MAG: hypothetical protein K9G33_11345, partial [Sneathiella sp.]|nr:hypothetical protein [Sneathiella sp.]